MKKKSAFSLIELSIVITIIGILIAGIAASSKIVKKSRLATARSHTQNAPIIGMPNLSTWYETSLETSFISAEAADSTPVSTWYDNNSETVTKNNAVQATATNKPLFMADIFNGAIPALRFDGNDNFMTFDGSMLVNTGYTIFIVEQRRAGGGSHNPFIGGTNNGTNTNLHLTYRNSTTITQAQYNNDMDYTIATYTNPVPRIHTYMLNTSLGKRYWLNGGVSADASNAQTGTLVSFAGSAIGRYTVSNSYFNGDIAEIIIFTRPLKTDEKQLVEDYLSKKYNIKIS